MPGRAVVATAVLVVLAITGCGASSDQVPSAPVVATPVLATPAVATPVEPSSGLEPTPSGGPVSLPPGSSLPAPHPAFARAFRDPLYYDQAGEFAPFGTDEGSDTMAGWVERRADLGRCTTVRWMIDEDDLAGALHDPSGNEPDVDGFLIGAGFALIYLTGHIDNEGKRLTLGALERTSTYYAQVRPPELAVMARDLAAFPATDCPTSS